MIALRIRELIARANSSTTLKAGIWYSVGNIFAKFLGFAALPVFSRLLTPSEYGTVAVFLTWSTIFTIGSSLYTFAVPVRARFDFGESYPQFISSLTGLGMIASLTFAIILALVPSPVIESLFGLPKDLTILAAVAVPVVTPFRIMLVVWQADSDAGRYILNILVKDILIVVISIALIFLPEYFAVDYDGVWGRVAGILIVRVAFGIVYLPQALRGRLFFNMEYWGYALTYAVPLIPHALSSEVLANFDRVMISQYVGLDEAGVYSFAYQLGAVVALIAAALSAAWFPWLYRHLNSEDYDLVRLRSKQYLLGFAGLTAAGIVFGVLAAPILAPASYSQAAAIVPVVAASGFFIFLQYFFVGVETHARKTWYTSIGTLSTAGLNLVLNWYFIPRNGFLAAAWTTLASYIVLFLVHACVVRFLLKTEKVNDLRLMFATSIAILLLTIVVYTAVAGI